MIGSRMRSHGRTFTKKISRVEKVGFSWKILNYTRLDFIKNYITYNLARLFSKATNIITVTGRLFAVVKKEDGTIVDYGCVAHGLVTTAFVDFLVDQMQTETSEFGDFKFHDSGEGTTAAAIGDTDIETTDGESRVTGSQIEGASSNIYKSVGTITYTSSLAITEHGLFSIVTGGVLLDRHVFGAINVVNTDQIEFTYEYTANSGG